MPSEPGLFDLLKVLFIGTVRVIHCVFSGEWSAIWRDGVFWYFLLVGIFSALNLLIIRWTCHLEKLPDQPGPLAFLCFLLWPCSTYSVIVEGEEQPPMPPCASLLYMRPWWYFILMPIGIWIKFAWNMIVIACICLVGAFVFLIVLEDEAVDVNSFTNRNRRTRELACHL